MAIPPDIKIRLEQLRQEMAARAEAQLRQQQAQQNAEKMSKQFVPGKAAGGLTRFLKDSSVKARVYHGTTSPESYDDDPHENAIRSFAGRATWVAEEPYTAHGYAGKSGYMMPLHVKIKKPLAINHVDANDDADHIYGLAKNLGVDVDHLKAMADPESVWEVINHPYFIDAAEKAGFDGISIKEGGRQTHAVFNPGNIKSAIGNRGTYDPRNPDITKAKGGSVPSIDEMRLAITQKGGRHHFAKGGSTEDSYRSEHTAPGPEFGAPMHDVTRDMYPKDFYGPNGFRYYADFGEQKDRDAYNKVTRVKGNPDEMVYIHRAIPTKVYNEALKKESPLKHMIRPGDWVAIHKDYAKEHGESVLLGDYKIASMRVPAKHVWTNGDSIHEWGYHPVDSKAEGGKVQPSVAQMKLALNQQGMYSPLEKAAMAVPRTKGTPAEFMAEISKQPGFRAEEVADRKISLPEQKLTKAEMLAHIRAHAAPKLEEKVLEDYPDYEEQLDRLAHEMYAEPFDMLDRFEQKRIEGLVEKSSTAYTDYQIPGGQNYREVLLKLPSGNNERIARLQSMIEHDMQNLINPESHPAVKAAREELARLQAEKDKLGPQYHSPHWKDDPNVLAHLRLSDRTGPNGEKILHVEEVQSDWHQAGRKKGYKKQGELPPGHEIEQEEHGLYVIRNQDGEVVSSGPTPELALDFLDTGHQKSAVPDAPFKKNWHELALKHALGMAAKGGYHGIAITSGQEQADRYDLSKHVRQLWVDDMGDGTWSVRAFASPHDEDRSIDQEINDLSKLDDYVGKDVAEKARNQIKSNGNARLSGLDLKVGGEGMKGFYDKIVPDFLNKIGKKHGAKVAMNALPVTAPKSKNADADDQLLSNLGVATPVVKQPTLHYFPITDSLRQQINTEGLPQYDLGGVVHKADGGAIQGTSMNPSIAQMKMALSRQGEPAYLRNIGINEAVDIDPKVYVPPAPSTSGMPAPGGVATPSGMPIGGIDMSKMTPGQQMMPMPASPQLPDPTQQGALPGAQPNPLPNGFGPQSQQQAAPNPIGGGNILQMTPQGRAMAAMSREFPLMPGQTPSNMAKGGSAKSVDEMKAEMAAKKKGKAAPKAAAAQEDDEEPAPSKRITIRAEGPGGVTGIVVPHHMWHGRSWVSKKTGKTVVVPGMKEINKARAEVYGSENRDPLSIGKMGAIHKQTLAEHFSKPLKEQLAVEKAATEKLRAAKHLGKNADTLDKSEKLDTVNHEHDAQGRTYVGFASKGVAGHALYTSGHGENEKHHILNTCPGQTEGCGGGKDAEGIVDTMRGTCFAPGAESQYVHAAVRRATHAQAKHDPAMTRDWILAHTGSIRRAAENADKHNKRLLFRPNVVDETDVSSRHVIRHLNEQRKPLDKPEIEANSYGKTNELHDPENGYHVTHSNVGPKVKKGQEISENIGRDKARVRNTVLAADNKGDFTNEQGHKTPPKGTYMVTDVKRGSKLSKDMEKAITHAKYWSTGRAEHELSEEEKAEGPEAHYSGSGRKTTEDKAHYGHRTVNGLRFDYQRQHILHPRLVQVGLNKDGTPHMIPTDSRFKDTEFLPKNRYKTKNGKDAGHILMTTPTESTSNLGHETSFTHHVNQSHVEHALKNNGEYEIDKPEDQIKARGKEYAAPQPVKFMAEGGSVARHPGLGDDDFHAFPEQNVMAQRHLAMRRGDDEDRPTKRKLGGKVAVHKDIDTMRLELTKKAK